MRLDAMILVFWMLSFKPNFSLSSFTFIKKLFRSSSFPAIRVVSSAYLRLLMFPQAILIPGCTLSSPAFHMMYSASWQTSSLTGWQYTALIYFFPSLEPVCYSMFSSNCCFLTCIQISQETSNVFSYFHLLKNFPQFVVIHTVKGFCIVNKAVDVCLEFSHSMIQQMLGIGSVVPPPFLNPAWTSGSSSTVEAWLGEFWALLC